MRRTLMEIINSGDFETFAESLVDGTWVEGSLIQERVSRKNIPDGKFLYDIRESDYGFPYGSIEKNECLVNWFGTLVTDKPIDFGDADYVEVDGLDFAECELRDCIDNADLEWEEVESEYNTRYVLLPVADWGIKHNGALITHICCTNQMCDRIEFWSGNPQEMKDANEIVLNKPEDAKIFMEFTILINDNYGKE